MALYRSSGEFSAEAHRAHRAGVALLEEQKMQKAGAALLDERLDSGVESLREDAVAAEEECGARDPLSVQLAALSVHAPECEEPWRRELSEDGDTYLHLAIIHEEHAMALKMIDMSINHPFLSQQNYQRQTSLHLAVITEQHQVVERLLKAGCDPTLVDNHGNTALHIACRTGSLTCFSLLTQNGQKHLPSILQTPNYSGQKCLHIAAVNGFLSLVENLIALGANINEQEQCNGRTALHLAVDLQNLELVRLLISKGADVNSLTYGGHTAYHLTYGRQDACIQQELYRLTDDDLRELPESESEDSEVDSDDDMLSDTDTEPYDDIKIMG